MSTATPTARSVPNFGRTATLCGAVLAGGVFAIWALASVRSIIAVTFQNSDNASALVLAEFLGERGHGEVVLGDYRWLEPLYALHLTRWLPAHRQLWELAPYLVYGVAIGLTVWTVGRLAGRRRALLVGLVMAVPAPVLLGVLAAPNAHGHTLLHVALLAAFLVTAPGLARWSARRRALWAIALAVTLAPGASSDALLLIGGVLPFAVALAGGWWLRLLRGRDAALAGTALAAGTVAGLGLAALATDAGIRSSGRRFPLSTSDQVLDRVRLLLDDLAVFAHGRFGGDPTVADVLLSATALVAAILIATLVLRGAVRLPRALAATHRPAEQRLALLFWATALSATTGAFVLTVAPVDIYSLRYLLIFLPGLLTLLAVMAPARLVTPGLATLAIVAATLGCLELARGTYTTATSPFVHGSPVGQLADLVEREGLDHGYAGYWDAATITVQTDFRARVYPVLDCGPGNDGRCPTSVHRIDAWYVPKPGVRTFYVVDDEGVAPPAGQPPARWGRPAAHHTFGQLQVFIYNYDLASVLPPGRRPPA